MKPDENFSREESYKSIRGGLKAQRLRAGPGGWTVQSGAVTVQIQTEAELEAARKKELEDLRGSNDSLDGAVGEEDETKAIVDEESPKVSSAVEPEQESESGVESQA